MNLGNSLHGGEEKVEEVRVGLLGFRKEVNGLKGVAEQREQEVAHLLQERREARAKIDVGRKLVDYDVRLKELERELVIEIADKETIVLGDEVSDSDEDEEDDEDEGNYGVSIPRLQRNVVHYMLVRGLEKSLDEHPFVTAQVPRMAKARSTLLMDLSTALQQAKSTGEAGSPRVVKILKIYGDMDESAEAVKVLKSSKAK